ncbi:MAG: hypothetical protein KAV18_04450, partial [Candidatus Omnitrophica bacterium]|nr:hypothetical protein [Candidatus Omnitrophota bacterium]
IASGTRRIEALTGPGALEDIKQEAEIIEGLKTLFKIPKEKILNSVKALQTELRQAGERIAESGDKIAGARIEQLLADSQKVGDINIIIGKLSSANMNQLRRGTDTVMSKAGSAIVVLGSSLENKVSVLARVSDDVIKKGVKAKEIIDQVCPLIDGRGGGKEKMAQGGGTRVKGLDKALEQAKKFITEKLV